MNQVISLILDIDWVNSLIFLVGLVNIAIGGRFAFTSWKTWGNPHPQGRLVTPVLFSGLALYFANNGIRGVIYYLNAAPSSLTLTSMGAMGIIGSLILTLLICVMVYSYIVRVEYELTSILK